MNFVGGEPTVCPFLEELLLEAKCCGLRTSIVSNGFNLVSNGLPSAFRSLDLLGLSIDSLIDERNRRMGRAVHGNAISALSWMRLFDQAGSLGLPIKINTTVSKFNVREDLSAFILEAAPERWKVFQAMAVEGQNCGSKMAWQIDTPAFERFVHRHQCLGANPVVESADVMRGSYAMVSPDGRFFDSTTGSHCYSDPILEVGADTAWSQVSFDQARYDARTHSYSEAIENE
jgi:radical S-adenosyl methionine domain-containing protein 2